ncbi:MAG: hypothetical protein N838_02320 [Thiohalocapsa sp. PB-PSB1]|nr:MAG: hypothetical protein N838_02320 [Thiohalocapsa sp. PB-PSB1]
MLVWVKAEVPNVLLLIAGEGPARKQLEGLTRRLGLAEQVRFIGYLNRDGSLEDFYAAGDAFVFASRTETQGLVLLESKAMGTPVISTAVMGTREVLSDGEGCLIATDEEQEFAAHCIRLLTDRALRDLLSAKAVRYAEQWSAPMMARRMLNLYQQVIESRKPSPVPTVRLNAVPSVRSTESQCQSEPQSEPISEATEIASTRNARRRAMP